MLDIAIILNYVAAKDKWNLNNIWEDTMKKLSLYVAVCALSFVAIIASCSPTEDAVTAPPDATTTAWHATPSQLTELDKYLVGTQSDHDGMLNRAATNQALFETLNKAKNHKRPVVMTS